MSSALVRRLVVVGVVPSALLATAAIAIAQTGSQSALLDPIAKPDQPLFASPCKFSHRASDDPIVFPRKPGRAHSHDFLGSTRTDADVKYSEMRDNGTSCNREEDTAGYWVPTLKQADKKISPERAQIYYLPGGKDPTTIKTFPTKLKVIAGDQNARAPQEMKVASWHCGEGGTAATEPPSCNDVLVLRIQFPDCWDGRNRDSKDHKSHMTYSARRGKNIPNGCPDSHPVPVPQIVMNVRYKTNGPGGISLASGGVFSGHADFLNAWDQAKLEELVSRCLNAKVHCGGS